MKSLLEPTTTQPKDPVKADPDKADLDKVDLDKVDLDKADLAVKVKPEGPLQAKVMAQAKVVPVEVRDKRVDLVDLLQDKLVVEKPPLDQYPTLFWSKSRKWEPQKPKKPKIKSKLVLL